MPQRIFCLPSLSVHFAHCLAFRISSNLLESLKDVTDLLGERHQGTCACRHASIHLHLCHERPCYARAICMWLGHVHGCVITCRNTSYCSLLSKPKVHDGYLLRLLGEIGWDIYGWHLSIWGFFQGMSKQSKGSIGEVWRDMARIELREVSLHGQRRNWTRHNISNVVLKVDPAKIDVWLASYHLLVMSNHFDEKCNHSFQALKDTLTLAPILITPKWS